MLRPTPPREMRTVPGAVECRARAAVTLGCSCAVMSTAAEPMMTTLADGYRGQCVREVGLYLPIEPHKTGLFLCMVRETE